MLPKLVQHRRSARLHQITNHGLNPRADPRHVIEHTVGQPLLRFPGDPHYAPRPHPKRPDLERILVLKLEMFGDLIQDPGHRLPIDGHRVFTRSTPAGTPPGGSRA